MAVALIAAEPGYYVGWGTLALVNAGIAQGKNRSGIGWFVLPLTLKLQRLEPRPRNRQPIE